MPILSTLHSVQTWWGAFFLIMAALIIVSGYTSINAVVKAELFPTEIRALGVGLPYALTVSVFGGSAEFVALWFKQAGMEAGYYRYVTACIACSLLVYVFMKTPAPIRGSRQTNEPPINVANVLTDPAFQPQCASCTDRQLRGLIDLCLVRSPF